MTRPGLLYRIIFANAEIRHDPATPMGKALPTHKDRKMSPREAETVSRFPAVAGVYLIDPRATKTPLRVV